MLVIPPNKDRIALPYMCAEPTHAHSNIEISFRNSVSCGLDDGCGIISCPNDELRYIDGYK
jgi:hypothetical protein